MDANGLKMNLISYVSVAADQVELLNQTCANLSSTDLKFFGGESKKLAPK